MYKNDKKCPNDSTISILYQCIDTIINDNHNIYYKYKIIVNSLLLLINFIIILIINLLLE